MVDFLQVLISGLTTGGLYALAAVGLVLLFRATGIINFAHGNMAMLATFVGYTLLTGAFRADMDGGIKSFLPYPLALLGGLAFAVLLGLLVERLVARPLVFHTHLSPVMACVGLLMLIDSSVGWIWGHDDRVFPPIVDEYSMLNLKGVLITYNSLLILGVAASAIVLFQLFLKRSRFGLAMRCAAEDLEAARLMGINYKVVFAASWAISAFMGGLAGMLLAPQLYLNPGFMLPVLIKGFVAAVIGGFSNIYGTILGALALGVLESLTVVYVSTELKNIFAFAVIILILSFRPAGLLPEKQYRREV